MSPNDSMTVVEAVKKCEELVKAGRILAEKIASGFVRKWTGVENDLLTSVLGLETLIAHAKSAPKEQIRAALEKILAGVPSILIANEEDCQNLATDLHALLTASLPPTEPIFTEQQILALSDEFCEKGLQAVESLPGTDLATRMRTYIRTILGGK